MHRLKISCDPKRLSGGGGISSGMAGVASGCRRRHNRSSLRMADAGAGAARVDQTTIRIVLAKEQGLVPMIGIFVATPPLSEEAKRTARRTGLSW